MGSPSKARWFERPFARVDALDEIMGDSAQRIAAPDVARIPLHSEAPKVPDAIKGLRVLLEDRIVGAVPSLESAAATKRECQAAGSLLASELGWTAVFDPSQPHDIVLKSDCTASAQTTTNASGAMFVLLPKDVVDARLETPDGKLVDVIHNPPITMACPVTNQAACDSAVQEFISAFVIGEIAQSTKLSDFATHLHAR